MPRRQKVDHNAVFAAIRQAGDTGGHRQKAGGSDGAVTLGQKACGGNAGAGDGRAAVKLGVVHQRGDDLAGAAVKPGQDICRSAAQPLIRLPEGQGYRGPLCLGQVKAVGQDAVTAQRAILQAFDRDGGQN